MAIDVAATIASGGRPLPRFLSFCVTSYRMEPIFACLEREYRAGPTTSRALALYDCFCAPGAPARMAADGVGVLLPPYNIRFATEMEGLRRAIAEFEAACPDRLAESGAPRPPPPGLLIPNHHFRKLLAGFAAASVDPVRAAGLGYDPDLTAAANLPGGRMSEGQRAFVDCVWRPRVAPMLARAGFRRAADLA